MVTNWYEAFSVAIAIANGYNIHYPQVKEFLTKLEVIFIPFVNPDGYEVAIYRNKKFNFHSVNYIT